MAVRPLQVPRSRGAGAGCPAPASCSALCAGCGQEVRSQGPHARPPAGRTRAELVGPRLLGVEVRGALLERHHLNLGLHTSGWRLEAAGSVGVLGRRLRGGRPTAPPHTHVRCCWQQLPCTLEPQARTSCSTAGVNLSPFLSAAAPQPMAVSMTPGAAAGRGVAAASKRGQGQAGWRSAGRHAAAGAGAGRVALSRLACRRGGSPAQSTKAAAVQQALLHTSGQAQHGAHQGWAVQQQQCKVVDLAGRRGGRCGGALHRMRATTARAPCSCNPAALLCFHSCCCMHGSC